MAAAAAARTAAAAAAAAAAADTLAERMSVLLREILSISLSVQVDLPVPREATIQMEEMVVVVVPPQLVERFPGQSLVKTAVHAESAEYMEVQLPAQVELVVLEAAHPALLLVVLQEQRVQREAVELMAQRLVEGEALTVEVPVARERIIILQPPVQQAAQGL